MQISGIIGRIRSWILQIYFHPRKQVCQISMPVVTEPIARVAGADIE